MDSWLSIQSAFLVLFFIISLVFVEVPLSLCSYDWYLSCSNQFNCGEITGVGYPFWGDGRPDACGNPYLKLNCKKNITTIEIRNLTYRVLAVNTSSKILKITREDYLGGICSPEFVNTTLDPELFDYGPGYGNITLVYGCPILGQFSCAINGFINKGVMIQVGARGPGSCTANVVVPVLATHYNDIGNWVIIQAAIKEGFDVQWKEDTVACSACTGSKGVCGYDRSTNQTTCYCPDRSNYGLTCPSPPAAGAPQAPSSESGMHLIFLASEQY